METTEPCKPVKRFTLSNIAFPFMCQEKFVIFVNKTMCFLVMTEEVIKHYHLRTKE